MRCLVRRLVQLALVVGGLLVILATWLPIDDVGLSFSGPTRVSSHFGILSPLVICTRYVPRRLPHSLDPRALSTQPDEHVWDHHGQFGNDIVVVKAKDQVVTVNYPALTCSVLVTLSVVGFAVAGPGAELIRSFALRSNDE